MRRSIVLIAGVIAILSGVVGVARGGAASAPLVVQSVDTSRYPTVAVKVMVPPDMAPGTSFKVLENNRTAEAVTVEELPGTRKPLGVVVVLDTSGSMRGRPLEDARWAAHSFIDSLGRSDAVSIIGFGARPRVVTRFSTDRIRLGLAIDRLQASGETAVYDALMTAASVPLPTGIKERTIVLLSDGGDTVSVNSLDNAVKTLRRKRIPVFAVGLSSPEADTQTLSLLAGQTNGSFFPAKDSASLLTLYGHIAREIKNQYVVSFRSAQPGTKDLDLDLEASSGGVTARASTVLRNPVFASGMRSNGTSPIPRLAAAFKPTGSPWLIAIVGLVFVSASLLVYGLVGLLARDRAALDQLQFYDQLRGAADEEWTNGTAPGRPTGLAGHMLGLVDQLGGKTGITKELADRLERAGLPLRPVEYILFHALGVVAFGLATRFLTGSLAVSIVAVFVAALGPLAVLEWLTARRRAAFQDQLPDVLNLIAGALRAGHGLQQAVDLVVEESAEPTSSEFRRVQTEARLGLPLESALDKMAVRLGSDDFRWAVSAISIQRDVGGNLAEVLDIVAETIRDRASLRGHARALSADARLSAVILTILPFAELFVIYLINPGYPAMLVSTTIGLALLALAAVLLIAGSAWLFKLSRIEV